MGDDIYICQQTASLSLPTLTASYGSLTDLRLVLQVSSLCVPSQDGLDSVCASLCAVYNASLVLVLNFTWTCTALGAKLVLSQGSTSPPILSVVSVPSLRHSCGDFQIF